jgi:hypothetical protein
VHERRARSPQARPARELSRGANYLRSVFSSAGTTVRAPAPPERCSYGAEAEDERSSNGVGDLLVCSARHPGIRCADVESMRALRESSALRWPRPLPSVDPRRSIPHLATGRAVPASHMRQASHSDHEHVPPRHTERPGIGHRDSDSSTVVSQLRSIRRCQRTRSLMPYPFGHPTLDTAETGTQSEGRCDLVPSARVRRPDLPLHCSRRRRGARDRCSARRSGRTSTSTRCSSLRLLRGTGPRARGDSPPTRPDT